MGLDESLDRARRRAMVSEEAKRLREAKEVQSLASAHRLLDESARAAVERLRLGQVRPNTIAAPQKVGGFLRRSTVVGIIGWRLGRFMLSEDGRLLSVINRQTGPFYDRGARAQREEAEKYARQVRTRQRMFGYEYVFDHASEVRIEVNYGPDSADCFAFDEGTGVLNYHASSGLGEPIDDFIATLLLAEGYIAGA